MHTVFEQLFQPLALHCLDHLGSICTRSKEEYILYRYRSGEALEEQTSLTSLAAEVERFQSALSAAVAPPPGWVLTV